MAIKYNDLYMDLRRRLREAGAEDATQAARELVCTASGKRKMSFCATGCSTPRPRSSVRRIPCARGIWRASRWPILSASGSFTALGWIFRPPCSSRAPTPRCWCRRSCMSWIPGADCRVLDLCAGSGCIGLAVASQVLRSRVLLGEWTRRRSRSAARTSAATSSRPA